MRNVMRDTDFCKITYADLADDQRHTMLIGNASNTLNLFEVKKFFDSWMAHRGAEILVVGIEEISGAEGGIGFSIIAEKETNEQA